LECKGCSRHNGRSGDESSRSGEIRGLLHVGGDCHASDWQNLIGPKKAYARECEHEGSEIEGGVSRRIVPGDIIVIPGGTPHWWNGLEGDIAYLVIRSDPDNVLPLRGADARCFLVDGGRNID